MDILNILFLAGGLFLFLYPGFFWALLFIKNKNIPNLLFLTITFSIAESILLGLIFMKAGLFNSMFLRSMLTMFFLFTIIFKRNTLKNIKEYKIRDKKLGVILLISLLITLFIVIFQTFPYPRGGDATNHFIMALDIDIHNELPETEIGLTSPTYYPRGLHISLAFLNKIINNCFETYLSYVILLCLSLGFSIYFLGSTILSKNKDAAFYSFLLFPIVFPLFIVKGNYNQMLALTFIPILISLFQTILVQEDKTYDYILFGILVSCTFITHVYAFYFLVLLFASIMIFLSINQIELLFKSYKKIGLLILVSLGIFFLVFLFYSNIILNQFDYFLDKSAIYSATGEGYSLLNLRTNTWPFILLFFGFLIFPIFIRGLFVSIELKSKVILMPYLFLALTLFFTSIFPVIGRDQFHLFYPLILLSGLGLSKIVEFKRDYKKLILLFLLIFVIFFTLKIYFISQNLLIGANEPFLNEHSEKIITEFEQKNITGNNISTLEYYKIAYVALKTENTALQGDERYNDNPQYKEIFNLYDIETTNNEKVEIIKRYKLNIIHLNENILSFSELKSQFSILSKEEIKVGEDTFFILK